MDQPSWLTMTFAEQEKQKLAWKKQRNREWTRLKKYIGDRLTELRNNARKSQTLIKGKTALELEILTKFSSEDAHYHRTLIQKRKNLANLTGKEFNEGVLTNDWGQKMGELRPDLTPHIPIPRPKKVQKSQMKEFVKFDNEKGVVYSQ